jgi:hypothetical protein
LRAGDHKVMPAVTAAAHAQSPAHNIDIFDVELVASTHAQMTAFSPLPLYRWFHNCNTPEDMAGIGNALVLTQ